MAFNHQKPLPDEVKSYFDGLAGNPKLVARSSTYPFPPTILTRPTALGGFPNYDNGYSRLKMLSNIGPHPIVQIYDLGPRQKILDILQGLPWYRIDVLRIGYYYNSMKNPVVVLITVKAEAVDFITGYKAVQECYEVLLQYVLLTIFI